MLLHLAFFKRKFLLLLAQKVENAKDNRCLHEIIHCEHDLASSEIDIRKGLQIWTVFKILYCKDDTNR